MIKDYITTQLEERFDGRETISREELNNFYKEYDPNLKEATFRWRIHDLKGKKIITHISKTQFYLGYKPKYHTPIGDAEQKLYKKIQKQFPGVRQCVWSPSVLNEFMLHQPQGIISILEVEPDALEPVFHFLKDSNFRNVYLQPSEKEMIYYVFETDAAIVLQPLISKAPIQKTKQIFVPTIEKILVDIYSDRDLYRAYQGTELINIVNYAYQHYAVDFTKLFSYAKRRRKDRELRAYLSANTNIPENIFND
ncbi:MAG: DUF6577 family protein [Anditalea sp.]